MAKEKPASAPPPATAVSAAVIPPFGGSYRVEADGSVVPGDTATADRIAAASKEKPADAGKES